MSQTSWRWVSLLSAWAALSPAALRAQAAADIVIEHGERVIPADGGLLVLVPTVSHIGAGAMAVPAQIEVTESDRPVAGQTREIGWIEDLTALSLGGSSVVGVGLVWTPAAPLVPGKRYVVRAALVGGDVQARNSKPAMRGSPRGPSWRSMRRWRCSTSATTRPIAARAFSTAADTRGLLRGPLRRAARAGDQPELGGAGKQLRQFVYLYRAYAQADGETIWASGFRTYDSALPYVPFLTPVADYCVEVRARHIVTDETFSYSRCVPASQLTEPLHDPASETKPGFG